MERAIVKGLLIVATILALETAAVGPAWALVVCAKADPGTGFPRANAKLVLRAECKAGKELALGIEITGSPGTDGKIVFDGVNVQVLDGSGDTAGAPNGLGNLIVGYNEDATGSRPRMGSHNLVVGPEHDYQSFGGLVAGVGNLIIGPHASVTGGEANTASGRAASVSGGAVNTASADGSSVTGGARNAASGGLSSVSGGEFNEAIGPYSSVSGGTENDATNYHTSVSGGGLNTANGFQSSVSGGSNNIASGSNASVSGGQFRSAPGDLDWSGGGLIQDF